MCGILCYIGYEDTEKDIEKCVEKLKYRGPDKQTVLRIEENIIFGFSRLAIMDLSEKGDQPMNLDDNYYLICNGEIYNYNQLAFENNFELKSECDCEIILHMYKKYGIEKTINELDGVFGFCLYDRLKNVVFVGRDPFGVRPLFVGNNTEYNSIYISSELKAIPKECNIVNIQKPGTYSTIILFDKEIINNKKNKEEDTTDELNNKDKKKSGGLFSKIKNKLKKTSKSSDELKYRLNHITEVHKYIMHKYKPYVEQEDEEIYENIKRLLMESVNKRLMSDRPIGCLLSGGLDSSLVSALVNLNYKKGELNTFSIGMPGSTDLHYAKIAADYLETNHHHIELPTDVFLNSIEEVIYHIESYDITTVRASIGNYLVSKYIKENTDCKVIYNGDGSEEIFGSYLWLSHIKKQDDFFDENLKLLKEIHYYDVLRSDRTISANGLEPRVPFLDKAFVKYIMSLSPEYKMFGDNGMIEKAVLRIAFDDMKLLPHEVLWRKKEAFSDGISGTKKSWFEILQEHIDTLVSDEEFTTMKGKYKINTPYTKESYYYRKIFEKYYPNRADIIPHFWMPNKDYCNADDPSARILNNYESLV